MAIQKTSATRSRRSLLRNTLVAATGVALSPHFAGRHAAGSSGAAAVQSSFDFEEADISALQKKMTSGEISARSLTEAYLTRIA